jgi:hypothetical protein
VSPQWTKPCRFVSDRIYPESDTAGRFTFSNLASGTYRVAAIGSAEWAYREEPGVVARWLTSAAEIVLSEQTVTIEIESKAP